MKREALVIERNRGDWLWVEGGMGWRLDPATHQWVALEDAYHLGGMVMSPAQVGMLVQMFGRPHVN